MFNGREVSASDAASAAATISPTWFEGFRSVGILALVFLGSWGPKKIPAPAVGLSEPAPIPEPLVKTVEYIAAVGYRRSLRGVWHGEVSLFVNILNASVSEVAVEHRGLKGRFAGSMASGFVRGLVGWSV